MKPQVLFELVNARLASLGDIRNPTLPQLPEGAWEFTAAQCMVALGVPVRVITRPARIDREPSDGVKIRASLPVIREFMALELPTGQGHLRLGPNGVLDDAALAQVASQRFGPTARINWRGDWREVNGVSFVAQQTLGSAELMGLAHRVVDEVRSYLQAAELNEATEPAPLEPRPGPRI